MYFSNGVEIVTGKVVRLENGDGTFDLIDIRKEPLKAPSVGYYPVELSGTGKMPDSADLTFDGNKYTGSYVPVIDDNPLWGFAKLHELLSAQGVNVDEIAEAKKTDATLEVFWALAMDGSRKQDPRLRAGLEYLENHASVPSAVVGLADAVLA